VDRALAIVAVDFGGNGLSIAVFLAILFAIVVGLALLGSRTSGSLYDRIGEGGLTPESDYRAPAPAAPESSEVREEEIRQMLQARSERLVRAGEPPLDIDAELARLLDPAPGRREHDHGLLEEVRQLVVARNDRRLRQGLEPLDVEAEVTRTLAELEP
jgi:hypothetical protein